MPEYVLARDMGGQFGAAGDSYATDDEGWAAQMVAAGYFEAPPADDLDEPEE